jgi:hypothetical protein
MRDCPQLGKSAGSANQGATLTVTKAVSGIATMLSRSIRQRCTYAPWQ